VIDHDQYEQGDDFTTEIDVTGPINMTTNDIADLPFTYSTPIAKLISGQRIKCRVTVKQGNGAIHAKWCPVALFHFDDADEGYRFSFKGTGALSPEVVVERSLDKMVAAAERPSDNRYYRPLIPMNLRQ
jgi:hypothetical protein